MSEKYVRLAVNLSQVSAEELRAIAEQRGTTITEAIRRCIAVHKFFTDEMNEGRVVRTQDHNGRNTREVLFL